MLSLLLLALALVGCAGQSPAAPEATAAVVAAETAVPTLVAGEIKVLPTPTPMPLPPTPTPVPTLTPAPTQPVPTGQPKAAQATALPTATTAPQPVGGAMVSIPAGGFTMGSDFEDQSPPHQVQVDAFEIDQFEVTNEAFEQFVLSRESHEP